MAQKITTVLLVTILVLGIALVQAVDNLDNARDLVNELGPDPLPKKCFSILTESKDSIILAVEKFDNSEDLATYLDNVLKENGLKALKSSIIQDSAKFDTAEDLAKGLVNELDSTEFEKMVKKGDNCTIDKVKAFENQKSCANLQETMNCYELPLRDCVSSENVGKAKNIYLKWALNSLSNYLEEIEIIVKSDNDCAIDKELVAIYRKTIIKERLETFKEAEFATLTGNADKFFLLVMGIVVFLMQCGFAFLEAGAVRSKNTVNILIKNMLDALIGGISYWAIGWGLAYGANGNGFCGGSEYFSFNMPHDNYPGWFFQFVFAATAATIVSGAIAERCNFSAYFAYSILITGELLALIICSRFMTSE